MLGDGYFDIVISPDEKEGGVWDVGFQGQFWWKWGLLFNASSNLQDESFCIRERLDRTTFDGGISICQGF